MVAANNDTCLLHSQYHSNDLSNLILSSLLIPIVVNDNCIKCCADDGPWSNDNFIAVTKQVALAWLWWCKSPKHNLYLATLGSCTESEKPMGAANVPSMLATGHTAYTMQYLLLLKVLACQWHGLEVRWEATFQNMSQCMVIKVYLDNMPVQGCGYGWLISPFQQEPLPNTKGALLENMERRTMMKQEPSPNTKFY